MISNDSRSSQDGIFTLIDNMWPGPDCPRPEVFTLDHWASMNGQQQAALQAHVETCAACQAEKKLAEAFHDDSVDVADVRQIAQRVRFPKTGAMLQVKAYRSKWMPRFAVAATLVCAVGFGTLIFQRPDSLPDLPERDPAARTIRGFDIALLPQATDGEQAERLRWAPVEGVGTFVVTVRNAAGEVVLTEDTGELFVALPDSLAHAGGRLRWNVVALDEGGMPIARSAVGVYFAGTGAKK
ncbi:MAG: hypothetical protein AB8G17_15250 [Gammaproteobacteria bacterium]